jgi:hypothetical protein
MFRLGFLPLIAPLIFAACSKSNVHSISRVRNTVQRGEYLVTVIGCGDCHTPLRMGAKGPELDQSRHLSGHPEKALPTNPPKMTGNWMWAGTNTNTSFSGPWGVTYSANLTPDETTGLGVWTEEMFVQMMRTGKHMGTSRDVQPPMPWRWYSKMSTDDLKSIYAYLRSIPPFRNQVPNYEPPEGSEYDF